MYENTINVKELNSALILIFSILLLFNTVIVVSAVADETILIESEKFTAIDGVLTDSETAILTLDYIEYFNLAGNATILWESTIASNLSRGGNMGDVTGDSISDILFVDESNIAPILTLYSGVDGSEIWTSTINVNSNSNYIDISNMGDLDGDGVDDILVLVEDYSTTYNDYTIAIKGTDGSQLWQKQESSSSDFYIQMYSIGDINGDAKDDIAYEYDCDSHFNLSIIDGGSGSTIWTHTESLSSESLDDWTSVWVDSSYGDLDRDGISDFFMHRYDSVYDSTNYTYDYNSQLTAISGKTGSLIWNMSSEYLNYNSISDIDGDGYNDVVISTYDQTLIVRGYDAYQLRTVDGDFVGTIDDVNENGFDDIVVSDYENLIALDVNTGNTIWTKPISTDVYFYYAFSIGDENGDGVNDLIALSNRYDQNTSYDIYSVISGLDGTTLWNKEFEYIYEYNSSTGSEYYKYSYLDTIENLDQDGKQYIVIYEYSQYCESWDSDYQVFNNWTAIRGSDGEVLWNLDKSGFGTYWPIYMDFNNDGVFDVLDYGLNLPSSSSFTVTESAVKSVSSLSTLSASLSQNDYRLPGQNQRYPDTFLSNIELNRPKFSSTDTRGNVSISAMQSSVASSSPNEVYSEESILSYARMFSGDSIDNMIWRVDSDIEIIPIIYGWGYYNDLNSDGALDVVLWNGDKLYALTDGYTSSDNVAPIANDQNSVTNEGTPVDITLSATDINGDPLTYIIVDEPTNGTVSLGSTINIATYTPNTNFNGTDSFTFKTNDGIADSNVATVSVTVNADSDSTISFDAPVVILPINSMGTLNLTIDSLPTGLSGYNITVSLSDENVAEIISVEFPAWAVINSNGPLPGDSVWLKTVDMMDQMKSGTNNVHLATLTVRGDNPGNTIVLITINQMDDDSGNEMYPNTISTKLEVILVVTFPGMSAAPTDPDGDGLYEDINGNNRIDFDDVVKYFNNLEWIPNNEPISCFDFNENGRIDFDDIVKLYNKV